VPVAPDVDIVDLARRADGLTGADLETLCKKATLLAIAEFQSGARGMPFVVHQRHFLTVLESGPSLETAS
jgi:transitional endoplasmic reticulum ATPase